MSAAPSPTIQCPSCKSEIRLTESLAAPLIESARAELEQKAQVREAELAAREAELRAQRGALEEARTHVEEEVAQRLRAERATLVAVEQQKARAALGDEIAHVRAELATRDELLRERDLKLAEARGKELELLRLSHELESQRAELELTVERKLSEERGKLREDGRRAADEDHRLRMAEKDKLISDMQRQVEELRRKAEQGSQQLQGEVLELALEAQLRTTFPSDAIDPVPKGEHGGDVVHRVLGQGGEPVGTLLWELKRTKKYEPRWLPKLREDQRAAKADLAILVSDALPDGIEVFGQIDGVWITSPRAALSVGLCLRQLVLEVSAAHKSGEGREAKMEMVYKYLTGPRFRQRVETIVEAFSTMQDDLDKERRAITKQWAKREEQIARALRASAGMYGDLQGIAGKNLDDLPAFDLAALEAPRPEPAPVTDSQSDLFDLPRGLPRDPGRNGDQEP